MTDEGSTARADPGDVIAYTFSVTTTGNDSDGAPVVGDFHRDRPSVDGDDVAGDDDGSFEVGETWLFTCSYTIGQPYTDTRSVTNTASSATSDTPADPATQATPRDNTGTLTTPPALTPAPTQPGEPRTTA